jgi:hypothetical protein
MSDRAEGDGVVRLAWVVTGVFVVITAGAVAWPDAFGLAAVVVSLLLFAGGCAAFLWAYARAVSRSRAEQVTLAGIFFLAGSAPRTVAVRLRSTLAVQAVAALAGAAARPYTNLAFGVLAPMSGLGLLGVWGARHGRFPVRVEPAPRDDAA